MAVIALWTLAINRSASAAGADATKLANNHPTALAQLGPVVHADPTMTLTLTVVLGVHDQGV